MIVAVAGCVAQAEGEEMHPARRSGRHRRGAAGLSPACPRWWPSLRAAARCSTRNFPRSTSSIPCLRRSAVAGPDGVADRAGRLRQVLHVLRRALYARRGIFAARWRRSRPRRGTLSNSACARSRCSGRTSMPITARVLTARRAGSGQLIRAPGADRWVEAVALHDQPSARHGRRSDCGACGRREADAVSASAGASRDRMRCLRR